MEKWIEKPKEVWAEQWWPTKKVNGVITNDPFVQTGSYMDRFLDRSDCYIVIDGDKKSVNPGDWIIYKKSNPDEPSYVLSDVVFRDKFDKK